MAEGGSSGIVPLPLSVLQMANVQDGDDDSGGGGGDDDGGGGIGGGGVGDKFDISSKQANFHPMVNPPL